MGLEEGERSAWRWRAFGQEPLDEADLLFGVEVAGEDVFGGEGNLDFWAGGRLEGGSGHWEEKLIATLLLDQVLLSS